MTDADGRCGCTVRIVVKLRPDQYDQLVRHVREIGSTMSAFLREKRSEGDEGGGFLTQPALPAERMSEWDLGSIPFCLPATISERGGKRALLDAPLFWTFCPEIPRDGQGDAGGLRQCQKPCGRPPMVGPRRHTGSFGGRSPMVTIFSSPVNHPARVADQPFGCPQSHPFAARSCVPPQCPPPRRAWPPLSSQIRRRSNSRPVSYLEPACHSNPTIGLQKIAGAYVNASSA
jgi:hypothetical protein